MSETVAVFRIGQLGDTIAAIPAIAAIRATYADSRMILITDEHPGCKFVSAWEILGATGMFSEVFFYNPKQSCARQLLNFFFLARKIRQIRISILFYLAPSPRDPQQVRRDRIFFQKVCRIKKCFGLETSDHLVGLRDDSGQLVRLPSETERLLSIVESDCQSISPRCATRVTLPIGDKERSRIDALWEEEQLSRTKGPIIGVGSGSKMQAKRWPVERFIKVGKFLINRLPEARIILFGGAEDYQLSSTICSALGPMTENWAGRLTVLETAEALKRCDLYLGNDTGVMHLAAAVGTRCVALFSARDNPGKWEPSGEGHIVLRKYVPCEGCLLVECRENDRACLKDITPEEVFDACLVCLDVPRFDSLAAG